MGRSAGDQSFCALHAQEWNELLSRFGTCPGCGRDRKDIQPIRGRRSGITIDRVVPLSRGGTNDILNLQPLCHSCNSQKGASLSWLGSRTEALRYPRCGRLTLCVNLQ